MRMMLVLLMLFVAVPASAQGGAAPRESAIVERSIDQLQADMAAGRTTSAAITRAFLKRIAAMDRKGPALHAIIAVNPDALADARALDAERKAGRVRGPLHGVPVLIKDNIETAGRMATTAGSLALAANVTGRDAPVVARLRAAGAVILAKANLSEWANIRSEQSMSGWSAVGGLVRNPYALDRSACGSSSGTGAGVAASFAAAGLGTETDGSVVCPAAHNGLVGMKPSIGLVSRTHIVPISASQDTAGPMARSVRDAALLLTAMVGRDPADPTTAAADTHRRDYLAALRADALAGMRVGVVRPGSMSAAVKARYEDALAVLREAGAVLVEVTPPNLPALGPAEFTVLKAELKAGLAAYLATTPAAVPVRTLAEVIAFNRAHANEEMSFFTQDIFESAEAGPGMESAEYRTALATARRLAGAEGIEAMLKDNRVAVIVSPTNGPAWLSDPVSGDGDGGPSASRLPAVAGTPHLTVPMGLVRGLPVGLSFRGARYDEATVLGAGFAYEQRAGARVAPGYVGSVR